MVGDDQTGEKPEHPNSVLDEGAWDYLGKGEVPRWEGRERTGVGGAGKWIPGPGGAVAGPETRNDSVPEERCHGRLREALSVPWGQKSLGSVYLESSC